MFQVLTGESWSEAVARPLLSSEDKGLSMTATVFFCSFVFINGVVLINVVVAVLLEKVVQDEPPPGEQEEEAEESERERSASREGCEAEVGPGHAADDPNRSGTD